VELTPARKRFILHWGEMGDRWGINRTMAQIHALLFLSPDPLDAEEITATLQVARSNVSTCLRELQVWGIVHIVHELGDRRDHFASEKDVWTLFHTVLDERKKREIDPTVALLRECIEETRGDHSEDYQHQRMKDMLTFFETVSSWYAEISRLPHDLLVRFLKAGHHINRWLGG